MTDMIGRATAAASNAWHECETCPGEMYVKEARIVARAALLAALDPEDEDLCNDIGCEIAGGSGDEAVAVEMAFHVKLVLRELRKHCAQGENTP